MSYYDDELIGNMNLERRRDMTDGDKLQNRAQILVFVPGISIVQC